MFHGIEAGSQQQGTETNRISRRHMFKGAVIHGSNPNEKAEAARQVLAMSPAYSSFSEEELSMAAQFNYREILAARRRQLRERPSLSHDVHAAMVREVHVLSILFSRGYVEHALLKEALDLQEASGHVTDAYEEYAAGRDGVELAATKVANMLGYLIAKSG